MPRVVQLPATLKPYAFLGLDVGYQEGAGNIYTDCPFCGRSGKFNINVDTGLWRCLVCAAGSEKGGGNILTFIRLLWDLSEKTTTNVEHNELAAQRRLLFPETLTYWGIVKSVITQEWLLPGYDPDGKLRQLYRYVKSPEGKWLALVTPELGHQLFGMPLYDSKRTTTYICEGPWDAMALWEVLRCARYGNDSSGQLKLVETAAEKSSLLAEANVIAVPGCNVFSEHWARVVEGKHAVLMFDNDHPKEHPPGSGKSTMAGYDGMKRVSMLLAKAPEQPAKISYLDWAKGSSVTGAQGRGTPPTLGHDPQLPHGYDVRDLLSKGPANGELLDSLTQRIDAVGYYLLPKITTIPASWIPGRDVLSSRNGKVDIQQIPCDNWDHLVNHWRRAMQWTEGLDRGFSVMLATIVSTETIGDQVWCKIIGPASCGKSTLCEALSVNKKYVKAVSTLRGFHSGFQSDAGGREDNSLLSQARNKTLVVKDGDPLLQAPNRSQILAEGRDVYDRNSRTHFRNGMGKDYEGYSMTLILCGTESLRALDDSELGERFVDCVIVENIDIDQEREIALRVAYRAAREMCPTSRNNDGTEETNGPEMVKAKQLTAGYITYLRTNLRELMAKVKDTDRAIRRCVDLGTFVAYMRARPSSRQREKEQREMSFRLTSQMVRLAKCMAVVLNKDELDAEVMRRVARVAIDTSRGRVLELVKHLFRLGEVGAPVDTLATFTADTNYKELTLLRFLRKIGVVESYTRQLGAGVRSKPFWKLTPVIRALYCDVIGDGT